MEETWNNQPRQFWRSVRKSVGLPASSDTGIVASMMKSLVALAEPTASVVISYPQLPGLYEEDIVNAAKHLNLPVLKGNHRYQPHTAVSTYAGHGMGLCASFTNKQKCTEEGLKLPVRHTLLVEYTRVALLLHSGSMREAYDLAWHHADIATSFNLGSAASAKPGHHDEIRELAIQLLRKRYQAFPVPPNVITVLVTGGARDVESPEFLDVIKRSVEEAGFEAEMLSSDPEHVSARGAAMLAWRALSLQRNAERQKAGDLK